MLEGSYITGDYLDLVKVWFHVLLEKGGKGGTISILPLVLRCSPYSWFAITTPKIMVFLRFQVNAWYVHKDSILDGSELYYILSTMWLLKSLLSWEFGQETNGYSYTHFSSPFTVTVQNFLVNLTTHDSDLFPSLHETATFCLGFISLHYSLEIAPRQKVKGYMDFNSRVFLLWV